MQGRIERLMEWRAGLLRAGRIEDLARQHICPMPIYVKGRMRSVASYRQLEEALRQIHAGVLALEAGAPMVKVRAVELPRGGRFRVWCDWLAPSPGRPPVLLASTVDYLRQTDHGPLTEMLECTCLAAHGSAA
jgi:hypothetical protein